MPRGRAASGSSRPRSNASETRLAPATLARALAIHRLRGRLGYRRLERRHARHEWRLAAHPVEATRRVGTQNAREPGPAKEPCHRLPAGRLVRGAQEVQVEQVLEGLSAHRTGLDAGEVQPAARELA